MNYEILILNKKGEISNRKCIVDIIDYSWFNQECMGPFLSTHEPKWQSSTKGNFKKKNPKKSRHEMHVAVITE